MAVHENAVRRADPSKFVIIIVGMGAVAGTESGPCLLRWLVSATRRTP